MGKRLSLMEHNQYLIKKTDFEELGCDFFTFSGHKVFGPMGIGVILGKENLLEKMLPYQGGGDMIDQVSFDGTTFAPVPQNLKRVHLM